jgi:ATP-dependent DNA helicase RecG
MAMLLTDAFPRDQKLVGTQRTGLRTVPEVAVRESLVNAIMHRDYRLERSSIVVLATGRPSDVLKVRSPGGLPPGVEADRLIATQSKPRNPALAEALRILGLAEKEGVGIDSIYRLMLRDGHPEPEISELDGEVVVRLSGGEPDVHVREFLDDVAKRDDVLGEDVRATIAVTLLFSTPVIRPEQLAGAAQSTVADAAATLERLARVDVVTRLIDRSKSYRLSPDARRRLSSRIRYVRRTALEDHFGLIEAYLDSHADIGREVAVSLLGVGETRASQVLAAAVKAGRVRRVGPKRGRLVRFRKP